MNNKIYQADAIEFMKGLTDNSVDLIISDPPYKFQSNNTSGGGFMTTENKKHFDKIKDAFGLDFNPKLFLEEAKRVMKKMNLYVFTNKNLLLEYMQFIRDNKYSFDVMLWLKPNPVPTFNKHYLPDKEYIIFMKDKKVTFNTDLGYHNYFTYFSHPIGRKGKVTNHATEKPIDPIKRMIQISSVEDDIVFDPYVGSGTVCVAAKELGRQYIGVDNEKEWVDVATDRLKKG